MKRNFYSNKKTTFFLFLFFVFAYQAEAQVNIYASPSGSATGAGDVSTAPVNLDRAKAIARANPSKTVTVNLASGIYSNLSLDASDSRAASYPVVYKSVVPNGAVFQPEITLTAASFQAIPAAVQSRIINATAKTKVKQLSLASFNLPDTAQWPLDFALSYLKMPRFYKNGLPLPMSRYPADTVMTMKKVIIKGSDNSIPGGKFQYRDDRAKYWLNAISDGGLYLVGNWQAPWQIDVIKTLSVNTTDSTITQAIGIGGGLGTVLPSRIASGAEPYYAINLVEEIAAEGQWSYNAKTKMLYMWPPASGTITCAGNAKVPAISATNVNYTQFIGLAVSGGSGNGYELRNCNSVLIAGAHIAYCSGNGVTITDGANCVVQSNDIDSVGAGGVIVSSSTFDADQYSLKASWHQVVNNHIYSFAREAPIYSAAININYAIGTYVGYNKVHDAPHLGIQYGGNNNILEYNEVYDVVQKYTDMGAFYSYGLTRGWLSRGNKIRRNYVHDAPRANGIYLDEFTSGDSVCYNIVANTVMGNYNHFGYFNKWLNNITVGNTYPITSMAEATTDAYYQANYDTLKSVWNASAAYKKAYPECVDMVGPAGRNILFTSRIWPYWSGNVNMGSIGTLSNVIDHRLFYDDGTTNASYAETGPAFVTWNTVFLNNIKLANALVNPVTPFRIDSLRPTGAFNLTQDKDWHINRIGLHKDAYRTDVSKTKVPGIDPIMTLTITSNNGYKNPGVVTLTTGVKCPNAGYILSAVGFYDNGNAMKGYTVTKNWVSYDSVSYVLQWTNPAVGYHHIVMQGNDGDGSCWQYTSSPASFLITSTAAATAEEQDSTLTVTAEKLTVDSTVKAQPADGSLLTASKLVLYPNPATNLITLNYTSPSAQGNANVMVYDLMGRVLVKKVVSIQEGSNSISIPLNNMPDGIYLAVLQTQGVPATSRQFMIKH